MKNKKQKGIVIPVDGQIRLVEPLKGNQFDFKELQKLVGGTIDIMVMPSGLSIVVNDNGKLDNLEKNYKATDIWNKEYPIEIYPVNNDQLIVGDVVIIGDEQNINNFFQILLAIYSSSTTLTFEGLEADLLNFNLDEAIKILDKVKPPVSSAIFENLSEEKMKIFKEQFKPQEFPTIQTQVFGIPVYTKKFVPLNEFWFVDEEGHVIKKFKF